MRTEACTPSPLAVPVPLADQTVPRSVRVDPQILTAERVPTQAVCLNPVDTTTGVRTTPIVLPLRHWLQVQRVHTARIPAEVIDGQLLWNGTNQVLVCPSVGAHQVQLRPLVTNEKLPITCGTKAPGPDPAPIRAMFDLLPEPFLLRARPCLVPTLWRAERLTGIEGCTTPRASAVYWSIHAGPPPSRLSVNRGSAVVPANCRAPIF